MKIALAGNPNSGKTTMFNALTGSSEKVGNWSGVTVDIKQHAVKKIYCADKQDVVAVDLPGTYSMSPFTSEEGISSEYIKKENPDVIINIVDATNLSRSLFFTTQLLELSIPVIVALNKADINRKKQTKIDVNRLSLNLGCPVIETVSTSADGLKSVIQKATEIAGTTQVSLYCGNDHQVTDKLTGEAEDRKRFEHVNKIVKQVERKKFSINQKNLTDKIDRVLTNKWLGIPIFAVVMLLVFQISQVWVGTPIADWLVYILEQFQEWVGGQFTNLSPVLYSLLIEGVLGGVIAVVGFLPLVMVMYFLIALLEDCGYMSRVAVVLDPIFKRVGLSGKSVIPFVITVGCAVPGIMASRTIKNQRERRATAMLAPFMPCGAKIPVIALFAGAFFEDAGWVSALMYLFGIVLIFIGALVVNKITGYDAKKSYFIIELAEYKIPSLYGAFKSMCARGWSYIVKAATIILLCNTVVQIMQSFTWSFEVANSADASILASVAQPFAYALLPIVGVLSWQLAAAAVTGFIAKENVVGTLAVCFVGLENLIDTEELALMEGAGAQAAGIIAITKIAALAYLMFNMYSPPCFAAIGAMNSEMKSPKWLIGGICLQLGIGYTVSYLVYTIGTLIFTPKLLNVRGAVIGGIAVAVIISIIVCLMLKDKDKKQLKTEIGLG